MRSSTNDTNDALRSPSTARFPNLVREARHSARFGLAELSRVSGVSERHLADIEAGRKVPSARVLHDLAAALDVTMDKLVEREWSDQRSLPIREAAQALTDAKVCRMVAEPFGKPRDKEAVGGEAAMLLA